MPKSNPFKWRHCQPEIILRCVRWYLSYPLSYGQVAEMVNQRGLDVHHTTVFRWVQEYSPELDKRFRPHLRSTNDSWRVDETYIARQRKAEIFVPCGRFPGKHLGLPPHSVRGMRLSAKRFFRKALKAMHTSPPRVITVDKNPAYPKAINELIAAKKLSEKVKLRQIKYLNNIVEQDHRGIKRLVKPGIEFESFNTARRTIRGYEIINMHKNWSNRKSRERSRQKVFVNKNEAVLKPRRR